MDYFNKSVKPQILRVRRKRVTIQSSCVSPVRPTQHVAPILCRSKRSARWHKLPVHFKADRHAGIDVEAADFNSWRTLGAEVELLGRERKSLHPE